jgi:two-component system CheB/CheR fusion protein
VTDEDGSSTAAEIPSGLDPLLAFIKAERGFDFNGYKKPSLARRIDKRLQARRVTGYDEYRAILERDPAEFAELFDTILINVTAFFRDELAWTYLSEEIVPRLIAHREDEPLRIWSTGCATGEEAFTIAIVFAEALGEEEFKRRVKIYATDVDDQALNAGRHATFDAKDLKPVPEQFREKYFYLENNSYAFRTDLRRSIIFGRHDLVQDPPISRIDLLVSRNTLMYFTPDTQAQVLANFHFALRDDGFLFLGKSEALTTKTNLFAAVDLRRRVFAKVPKRAPRPSLVRTEGTMLAAPSDEAVRDAVIDAVPAAVIALDREGKLALANLQARVQFGITPRDLGRPIQDLEISFRPLELRSRIEQAYVERHSVSLRDVEWRTQHETRFLDIQVTPLTGPTGEVVGCSVAFTEVTRYRRLELALQEAKREAENAYEELQSTVEELETTNEELQATNEELETTNEELQATNEELETTNEELQSTNEELETMNAELHQRGIELNSANAFLEAVLTSIRAGVVVVDGELRVLTWNSGARDLWGLTQDEVVGQHLLNLDIGLPVDRLRAPIRSVLADGDRQQDVVLHATNRRGRAVVCRVNVAPLGNDGQNVGAILMMQAEDSA